MNVPFIIYADLGSFLEKMNTSHNNPKKSSTSKINKHTPYGLHIVHPIQQQISLIITEAENCMKNFCLDLKEHVTKIIKYGKKKTMPLTYEENKSYKKQKACYICKKRFSTDDINKKSLSLSLRWKI